MIRLRKGEFELAESHFSRAHRWAPRVPEVCYALGRERLRHGRVDEAEDLLRTAWRGDRTLTSAAATLARCLALYQNRFAEAHAVLDDAERDRPSAALAVVRSEVLIEERKIEAAEAAAEAALSLCDDVGDPGYESTSTREAARAALARVHNHRGVELADRGELEAALFRFKRAADLDPRWSSPHVNMGTAFVRLGKLVAARHAYQAAIAADPDNPVAHENLGLLFLDLGELASARAALETAVDLDPEPSAPRTSLAETYLALGEIEAAVTLLAKIADERAGDPGAWVNLSVALIADGDREGGETSLRKALDLDPNHVAACCRLADLLARDGRYLEAAMLAERAQELDAEQAASLLAGKPRTDPRP